ncbi:MAG: FAD-dependent monooxygenase [Methylococcales bacterium]|nr:FAD-dependent monooxygenase [Methylococcales bacterium]
MNQQFDICIIGAGMAGATIAAYLAPKGIKIALIDRGFTEKNRIVGELLQPGAVQTLTEMGLGHLLDGFDGQPIKGYALLQDEDQFSIPYNKNDKTDFHGVGLHNGRFLQQIRASAIENPSVTKMEGAATDLIEDKNGVVTGVKFKDKVTRKITDINAKLTITSDGFFSSFRKELSKNEKKVTSFFIGLVLKDCPLPSPNHGHVFLSGPTPFICYPISSTEVRLLIDFPGDKAPKRLAIKEHLKNNVEPFIPESLKAHFNQAVNEEDFKVMPNHYLAAKPVLKKGVVMLGDALNMRHPLTGGGITAVFSDVRILGNHLMGMADFSNTQLIHKKVRMYYKERCYANANVNILANALYGVMSNDLLKTAVFQYIKQGGDHAIEPIAILAGLNKNQKTLIKHFVGVVLFGAKNLLKQGLMNIPKVLLMLWQALKIIKPLLKNELNIFTFVTQRNIETHLIHTENQIGQFSLKH